MDSSFQICGLGQAFTSVGGRGSSWGSSLEDNGARSLDLIRDFGRVIGGVYGTIVGLCSESTFFYRGTITLFCGLSWDRGLCPFTGESRHSCPRVC